MAENHIIDASYKPIGYCRTRSAFQYDYGLVLRLNGFDSLPYAFEMHFASSGSDKSITKIGENNIVEIPDECFLNNGEAKAWIFLHDTNTDGETRYVISIPVEKRAAITNIKPKKKEQTVIEQAIAVLNNAVETTNKNVETTEQIKNNVAEMQQNVVELEALAEAAKDSAQQSANQAHESYIESADILNDIREERSAIDEISNNITNIEQNIIQLHEETIDNKNRAAASAENAFDSASSASDILENVESIRNEVNTAKESIENNVDIVLKNASDSALAAEQAAESARVAEEAKEIIETFDFNLDEAVEEMRSLQASARTSANNASTSASQALSYANNADMSATRATTSATNANKFASNARAYAASAENYSNEVSLIKNDVTAIKNDVQSILVGQTNVIAPYETGAADRTYSVGELFLYNNKMYKAIIEIPKDTSFIPGTNCELTSIAEELSNGGGIETETDPTVPEWAKQPEKPSYTASEVGALPADTVIPDISGKADKADTVLATTLSRGRVSNKTIGNASFAFGEEVEASGDSSHAEGYGTIASGYYSHAEGAGTTASSTYSHAEGDGTKATGLNSHSEGGGTIASGNRSHAEGLDVVASGTASHAEGGITASNKMISVVKIIGDSSIQYGYGATGDYAHSEGYDNAAAGHYSHAEGSLTVAYGNYSHAEGSNTIALGNYSHTEGNGTIINLNHAHVQGTYNVLPPAYQPWKANTLYSIGDKVVHSGEGYVCIIGNSDASFTPSNWRHLLSNGDYAFVIGNGTSNSSRSNAMSVKWNGDTYFMGDVYVNANSDGTGETKVAKISDIPDITNKADLVSGGTTGNFVSLDANGNITDSGHSHSDYLTQHQSLSNYVQKTDYATQSTGGVVKVDENNTSVRITNGVLDVAKATQSNVKTGTETGEVLTPANQHYSVFYGLAKIAGVDEKDSVLAAGVYSQEAKTAIQSMLGIESGAEIVRLI